MSPDELVDLMRETGTEVTARELPPFEGEADWLATLDVLQDDDDVDREWLRRIWTAAMLAKTVDVCDALLRGERVPIELLDAEWVDRFGLKVTA